MSEQNPKIKIIELAELGVKLTPMMKQYYEIKKDHLDEVLMFRMGDFYEVFFEDAIETTKALNIALTHRGKLGDYRIPMAGIPYHAASAYFDRLTGAGFKLAICEQVEDPADAVGIVKRAVVQHVTPGMPYDLDKTDEKSSHFISSTFYCKTKKKFYLVSLDFTSGNFLGQVFSDQESFIQGLYKTSPKELILSLGQWEDFEEIEAAIENLQALKTHLSLEYFDARITKVYSEKLIPHLDSDQTIKKNNVIAAPVGALAYYINASKNIEALDHLKPFKLVTEKGKMLVSYSTLKGLEVLPRDNANYRSSLLGFLDKCKTSMGARYLKSIILNPLDDYEAIIQKQKKLKELISFQKSAPEDFKLLFDTLNEARDIERILAKSSTGKINGQDLINLANTISCYFNLNEHLKNHQITQITSLNKKINSQLNKLQQEIASIINDELGASLKKGNLIKEGADKERDRLANIANKTEIELSKLEARYREETGINVLKIKSNNVFGYFIEISKSHTEKAPKHFTRRQTLTNSERYTTEELKTFEKEILTGKERLEQIEKEIFNNLVLKVKSLKSQLQDLALFIAEVDTDLSLSFVSYTEGFTCPKILKSKSTINLKGVWHPLIKSNLKELFVSHSLLMNKEQRLALITGPNMAGKTTVMREVALTQLLTQIGCFVPATSCEVSLCDAIFSRLGASDDILKGRSTFMVEMAETAEILRHASSRSLVILDEVGRGTSTYDGLSIAWSLVEHFLEEIKCITLFATHYHELIELADNHKNAKNLTVEIKNINGEIEFLYNLIEGGASQSFGIHVAKLAGLPSSVLGRSKEKLLSYEQGSDITTNENQSIQLSFLANENELSPEPKEYLESIERKIRDIDLLNTTPLKALDILDSLRKELPLQ